MTAAMHHTHEPTADWNAESLHVHFHSVLDGATGVSDAQIAAVRQAIGELEHALRAAMDASERAVAKAEITNEKRFDAVNEFRAHLSDQQKTFVTRSEIGAMLDRISDHVATNRSALELQISNMEKSRNGQADRLTALNLALQEQVTLNTATYLPRAEYQARHEQLLAQVDTLKQYQATSTGRYAATPTTAEQIAAISAEVQALRDFREHTAGRTYGLSQSGQIFATFIGLTSTVVATVLGILLAVHK